MAEEIYTPYCNRTTCPLNRSCTRPNFKILRSPHSKIGTDIDILLVADSPTIKDMYYRTPLVGPEGDIIRQVIQTADPNNLMTIGMTHIVKGWACDTNTLPRGAEHSHLLDIIDGYSEDNFKWTRTKSLASHDEKHSIISHCKQIFEEDIARWRPKKIVVMGAFVKDVLFPNEKMPITRLVNEIKTYKGIRTRFISSATNLLRNPSCKPTWTAQLLAILTNKIAQPDVRVGETVILKTLQESEDYISFLENDSNTEVSFDIETLNLNKRYGNKIATLQFATDPNKGYVIPYNHPESPFIPDEIEILRKRLYNLFHKPNKITHWVGQNLKFENNVCRSIIGSPLTSAPMFDTMVAGFLLDENRSERVAELKYGTYSLKQLAYEFCNFDGYDKGILAERADGNLFDLGLDDLSAYGAMDAYITLRLSNALKHEADNQNFRSQLLNLMFYLFTPMILMFSDIEYNGFYVGKKHLRDLISNDSSLKKALAQIKDRLRKHPDVIKANDILLQKKSGLKMVPLGRKPWIFDFNKEGHAQTLFFDVLGLTPLKIGKSGRKSVDNDFQNAYSDNELVKELSEWNSIKLLYDNFATTLYNRIDPTGKDKDCNTDCKIRPNFIITGPVTGRIACRDPNLQNIPRADNEYKKSIKNVFQALPGHILVQLDYKSNEVRWVGILSQDDNLAEAFWKGKKALDDYRENPSDELLRKADIYGDIHKQTASMVFGKEIEQVSKDERQASKAVTFGILYGSGIKSIAEKTKKSVEEVETWFFKFYDRFPKVAIWKQKMECMARDYGYVEASHGRRRRFPIFLNLMTERGFDENNIPIEFKGKVAENLRQSINAPIQGIASDNGMVGAALFAEYIRNEKRNWQISNAVHDSCIFQVPYEELNESLEVAEHYFTKGVMEYMTDAFDINFNLPLEIDFEMGLKWGELHKWNFNLAELEELKTKLRMEMA